MERLTEKQLDLLSQYIDGTLSPSDATSVEVAIQNSEAMREHLTLLKLIGRTLVEQKPEPLSRNFTDQVMINLQEYPATSVTSVRNGVFLLIGVLIAVGVALVLVANGAFDNSLTSADPTILNVSRRYINTPFPTITLSGKWIVNTIIVLNLALAWIVLDRTILKPLFQRRMQGQ